LYFDFVTVKLFVGLPDEAEEGLKQIDPFLIGDGKLEPKGSAQVTLHLKISQLDELKFVAQVSVFSFEWFKVFLNLTDFVVSKAN
jgi:hypothetical protein